MRERKGRDWRSERGGKGRKGVERSVGNGGEEREEWEEDGTGKGRTGGAFRQIKIYDCTATMVTTR